MQKVEIWLANSQWMPYFAFKLDPLFENFRQQFPLSSLTDDRNRADKKSKPMEIMFCI